MYFYSFIVVLFFETVPLSVALLDLALDIHQAGFELVPFLLPLPPKC